MISEEDLNIAPYSLAKKEKVDFLNKHLLALTRHHYKACPEYKKILDSLSFDIDSVSNYTKIPFLSVRLFKHYELRSVKNENIVKTLTSSGTMGQQVSKIFLDRKTSAIQTKVLTKIVSSFLGKQRVPMLILDTSAIIKNRATFSARGAGILGFSIFGTDKLYAFDEEMKLDIEGIKNFLEKHKGETILLFGFTFMIWQHFYKELKARGYKPDLSKGILIHGGGWKKLVSEAVSPHDFKDALHEVCGINHVYDYYGMVEQTGTIYLECECGHLHTSIFSDVICRRPKDFSVCDYGEEGIIEVLSVLPESYPGHVILTEDMGIVLGEDDCPCGRKGKYFIINGRIKNAEIRGCSDTYAADAAKQQGSDFDFSDVRFIFPGTDNIGNLVSHKSFPPFNDTVCSFLNEVSQRIMKDNETRQYPDVITFGFFCRKANIEQMRKSYGVQLEGRLGRGLTFHIAPSNVPINFAYTLVAGLLSGNRCIVRASSKDFPQTRLLCRIFKEVSEEEEFAGIKNLFSVIMYGHSEAITKSLSALADIRVIWGGDNTIGEIRKSSLKPRAFDITFADRYSFAVFNTDFVIAQDDSAMKKVAQDFYNDTYLYDQNACSSPRLIVWLGKEENCIEAKEKFWKAVHENIFAKYAPAPILVVNKLSEQYKCAVELEGIKIEHSEDNLITRIRLSGLPKNITDYTCAGGCYLEYNTDSLSDIAPVVTQKFQTLSYLGIGAEEIRKFVIENRLCGIDRIVPVGKTANFGLIWDGYDLVMQMSRVIFGRSK